MGEGLARARADLEAGRPWKARDRLAGLLTHRQDAEVLDLLATTHYEMRDLPAAGALWFVTGRDDDQSRRAIAEWEQKYDNAVARWHSLPKVVRRNDTSARVSVLRQTARQSGRSGARDLADPPRPEAWWEPVVFGGCALTVLVWVVVMVVIGMTTVWRWIWG